MMQRKFQFVKTTTTYNDIFRHLTVFLETEQTQYLQKTLEGSILNSLPLKNTFGFIHLSHPKRLL